MGVGRWAGVLGGAIALAQPGETPPGLLPGTSFTAMGLAAQLGRVDSIKTLADHGADPNLENREGLTPLMMALETGQQSAIAALLQVGQWAGAESSAPFLPSRLGNVSPCHVMSPAAAAACSSAQREGGGEASIERVRPHRR